MIRSTTGTYRIQLDLRWKTWKGGTVKTAHASGKIAHGSVELSDRATWVVDVKQRKTHLKQFEADLSTLTINCWRAFLGLLSVRVRDTCRFTSSGPSRHRARERACRVRTLFRSSHSLSLDRSPRLWCLLYTSAPSLWCHNSPWLPRRC